MTGAEVFSGPSDRRIQLAVNIAQSAPTAFGSEAAVVGSASRGTADNDSDVDIQFWVIGKIPSIGARETWLADIGGTDVTAEQDERTLACRLGELWLELTWVSEAEETLRIERLRSGKSTDREDLVAAASIMAAIPLRSSGRLAEWKVTLAEYPEALRKRLILDAADFWRFAHRVDAPYVLARRGEPFLFDHWISADVRDCLRILCALNRCWEPDWKALSTAIDGFVICPDQLQSRLAVIFSSASLEERARESRRLMRDVLRLSASFDVRAALNVVERSFTKHTPVGSRPTPGELSGLAVARPRRVGPRGG